MYLDERNLHEEAMNQYYGCGSGGDLESLLDMNYPDFYSTEEDSNGQRA